MGLIADLLKQERKKVFTEGEIIELVKKKNVLREDKNIKRHIRNEVEREELCRWPTHQQGTLRTVNLYYLPNQSVTISITPLNSEKVKTEVKVGDQTITTGQTLTTQIGITISKQLKDKVKWVE